jgi:hypothetical protein
MGKNLLTGSFNDKVGQWLAVSSKNTPDGTVNLDQALEIFDQLADRPDIAFGSSEGCCARAHIMCRALMDMGLISQKAWAFEGKNKLQQPNGDKTTWWYHVTAAFPVKMPDGKVQNMVIDPSLFDGPVSLKEWGDIMGAPAENLQIVPFGAAPEGRSGDYDASSNTTDQSDKDSARAMKNLQSQDAGPRLVFQSQSRQQVAQRQAMRSRGKTWVSAKAPAMVQAAAAPKLSI